MVNLTTIFFVSTSPFTTLSLLLLSFTTSSVVAFVLLKDLKRSAKTQNRKEKSFQYMQEEEADKAACMKKEEGLNFVKRESE